MTVEPDLDDIWRRLHDARKVAGWAGHEYQDEDVLTRLHPHTIWVRGSFSSDWVELRPTGRHHYQTP
ncbi:MAG TPA: hypothetical protein VGF71_08075 [Caulobacteraceae bacterium]|jgi:hypothetical protein